jgi:hypothetical protein
MGEIRNLIGIYGAIDRVVDEDAGRRTDVSRLLPVYGRDKDVRWFDEFDRYTREHREAQSDVPPFPETLEEALTGLAEIPPRGRMRARRMWAVAVAAQAFPELRRADGDLAGPARAALRGPGIAPDDDRAGRLLELLGEAESVPPLAGGDPGTLDAWWNATIERAHAEGVVEENVAVLGPRPCSGQLVPVDGRGLVTALRTQFTTDQLTFAQAIRFLEPGNWPGCSSFWCEMTEVGVDGDVHHYREVVSTDCGNRELAWTVHADLDFTFRRLDGVAITDYRMSHAPQPDDDVLVDEGSLLVRRLGSAARAPVEVTTTKRVRFNGPFSGEALALVMCACGYAAVAEDLVFSCAIPHPRGGTAFPAGGAAGHAGPKQPAFDVAEAIEALGARAQSCAEDWAQAARATSQRIADGTYDADALAQDLAGAWTRLVRESAENLALGLRSARSAAGRDEPGS